MGAMNGKPEDDLIYLMPMSSKDAKSRHFKKQPVIEKETFDGFLVKRYPEDCFNPRDYCTQDGGINFSPVEVEINIDWDEMMKKVRRTANKRINIK